MQKALEYFMKALKITEENNDKQGHAYALNNIGFIYDRQGQREKAFECLMKALKIREEIGDKRGVAESLNNIGWNYDHQGQTEKGLEYFKKSLKLTEEIDDKHGIAHTLNNIGGVYLDNCKLKTTSDPLKKTLLDSALAYSSRSLTISKEIGFPENIRNASEQLTEIYKLLATSPLTPLPKRLDFWQSAYEMYELYKIMADSISNMEIHKASMQYEFDKREAQAKSEQEKKDLKAVAEKRRQQLILILVMAIAAAAGAIAVVIFRSLRITRRQKLAIEEQKKVVEEKQKEILDSIHYARRIQQSLLPTEKYIDKTLKRLSKNN
jgi:tetratricopeptide (TPR) repeat protein